MYVNGIAIRLRKVDEIDEEFDTNARRTYVILTLPNTSVSRKIRDRVVEAVSRA